MTGPSPAHAVVDRSLLQAILDRLATMPDGLRQALTDQKWAEIPFSVTEAAYNPAQAAGAPLLVKSQAGVLELITSVTACVPAGATGIVQLGSIVLYVPAGVTTLAPVNILLATSDTRSLTVSSAGPTSLLLTGSQMPTFGTAAQ